MTSGANSGTAEKIAYEAPSFQCDALRLVTLGGTPGAGDSGAPGSQDPLTTGMGDFDEGDDYW